MKTNGDQTAPLALISKPRYHPFRLHVNDIVRIDGKMGRVIRVTESAAVVSVNRPPREFTTRFDKHVRFRLPPMTVRISANSEIEILNQPRQKRTKRRERSRT